MLFSDESTYLRFSHLHPRSCRPPSSNVTCEAPQSVRIPRQKGNLISRSFTEWGLSEYQGELRMRPHRQHQTTTIIRFSRQQHNSLHSLQVPAALYPCHRDVKNTTSVRPSAPLTVCPSISKSSALVTPSNSPNCAPYSHGEWVYIILLSVIFRCISRPYTAKCSASMWSPPPVSSIVESAHAKNIPSFASSLVGNGKRFG